MTARGTFLRWIFGIAKKPVDQLSFEPVAFIGRLGINHPAGEVAEFSRRKRTSFEFYRIAEGFGSPLDRLEGGRRILDVQRPPHRRPTCSKLFREPGHGHVFLLHRVGQRAFDILKIRQLRVARSCLWHVPKVVHL